MSDEGRFLVGPPSAPDRYIVVRCLGGGGEGEVWSGLLPLSPTGASKVAVKILRDDLFNRDDASWERHAQLLHAINHPGLVRVREAFTGGRMHRKGEVPEGEQRYVVMDLVEGKTLRSWLAENPDASLRVRLEALANVAAALDEMHSGRQTGVPVAHGDVKPGNIVVPDDGLAVLVDLGLMRIFDGTVIAGGTVPYAAPELFRDGAPTTPATDRFAFIATVTHAILGDTPPVSTDLRGPDLAKTAKLLEEHPLTATRPALRFQLVKALSAAPDERPANLTRWLSSLTDTLSAPTHSGGGSGSSGVPVPPKPKRSRTGLVATAAALAAVLAATGLVLATQSPGTPPVVSNLAACAHPDQQLLILASQDKAGLLSDLAKDYGPRASDGHCISIKVEPRNSGKIMNSLTSGWQESDGPAPDVWSPASSVWLALTSYRSKGRVPSDAPSLFGSPLVIGMPKPMAEALGWPNTSIGWHDFAALARDPQAWAAHGHPEWGAFQLGKTNPLYSASGFIATIGAYFAYTGHGDELTDADIDNPQAQDFVRSIERSVVHYGDTTLTFLANLRRADDNGAGLSYVSAVTLEESSLVAYNLGYPCGAQSSERGCAKASPPKTPLVAIYPKEGTLRSDHPYVKMPGITPAKASVADDFLAYVHSDAALPKIGQQGFRAYDGRPTQLLTTANGALPNLNVASLGRPSPEVLDRLINTWPTLRKPANVLLLVDTSTSMADPVPGTGNTKMTLIHNEKATIADASGFSDLDRVGLWRFADDYVPLVAIGAMDAAQRTRLATNIGALTANGGTALYDTVGAAVATIRDAWDPNAINAVIVLTDGRNETGRSSPTLDALLDQIRSTERPVRVFTIAYGNVADQNDQNGQTVLGRISSATGADRYDATNAATINDVLIAVVSNF